MSRSEQTEYESSSESSYENHPALKGFNRTAFMAKYVLKKTLKWGAIAAVGVGAAAAVATFVFGVSNPVGWALTALSVVKGWFTGSGLVGGAGDALGGSLVGGLKVGAFGGGLLGMVTGISDASEAADAEEARLYAKYDQAEARRGRMAKLEELRDRQRDALERQTAMMRAPGHSRGMQQGNLGAQGHAVP